MWSTEPLVEVHAHDASSVAELGRKLLLMVGLIWMSNRPRHETCLILFEIPEALTSNSLLGDVRKAYKDESAAMRLEPPQEVHNAATMQPPKVLQWLVKNQHLPSETNLSQSQKEISR